MKRIFFICLVLFGVISCCANNIERDVIYDPIRTPIYMGRMLFCSIIEYNHKKVPCDPDSRLIVYSNHIQDTVQGVLQFKVYFDIEVAAPNKELPVIDIDGVEFIRFDQCNIDLINFISIFREELLKWHWWLGDYLNPLTLYSQQVWVIKFMLIPQITNE